MISQIKKESILVLDDAIDTLEVIQRNLLTKGYKVYTARVVEEAMNVIEQVLIDLVITDLKMPRGSGLDIIRHIRENYKNTEVMMITGYATIENVVKALKLGAEEFLTKPFTDEELFNAVQRALDKLHTRRAGQMISTAVSTTPYGLIGESEVMKRVFSTVTKSASVSATVLITGESGTGKELVARAIHYTGSRSQYSFVAVNCGGIPESLSESEMFGHIKGAFTGATESRAGFFQTADCGTIFLDEISETSPSMQVKLLRVLQDKEIYMVGSSNPIKVDVRIIAATNKDLQKLVEKRLFREDLFYRLNVINIEIPPLRERGDDVLLFISHFISKFAKELGKQVPKFSNNAMTVLKNYHYPGNVRELENIIQRLVVMTDEEVIDVSDLPKSMRFSVQQEPNINRTLEEVETEHIRNVMVYVDGNKTKAAQILGIDRKTLREKTKKYGIKFGNSENSV